MKLDGKSAVSCRAWLWASRLQHSFAAEDQIFFKPGKTGYGPGPTVSHIFSDFSVSGK
jgi:hypothetical protein